MQVNQHFTKEEDLTSLFFKYVLFLTQGHFRLDLQQKEPAEQTKNTKKGAKYYLSHCEYKLFDLKFQNSKHLIPGRESGNRYF